MNQQTTSAGEVVEKREPECTVGGNADWCSQCGKQYGISSKKLKTELPFDPPFPLLRLYPKNLKHQFKRTYAPLMFIAALFTIAKC